MADSEARKILGGVWASSATALRTDPEDMGIDRADGWTEGYEQIGSGLEPEGPVWNQRWRELGGWAAENMRTGGLKGWDPDVNYLQYARAAVGLSKYAATVATGPAHGNTTDPLTPGQQVWRLY